MTHSYWVEQLRNKIIAITDDKANSFSIIDELTDYIGQRLMSDSAELHALRAKEAGGSAKDIISAAFYGAFGESPKAKYSERVSSEQNSTDTP